MRAVARVFPVRDLQIAAKEWGAGQRVLALHGWLDNAGSFDVLAPLLSGCHLVALDLPGQGLSSHRPACADYHLWNDLVDVLLVADQLGWEQFVLLGHSRGAMLSVMLAASFPERVQQLFLLDGLMPLPVQAEDAPQQLRQYVKAMAYPKGRGRCFATKDEAISLRARATAMPIPETVAAILVERNLQQEGEGWVWRYDDRLKGASAVKMTGAHNRAFLNALDCPVSVMMAEQGMGSYSAVAEWQQAFSGFDWLRFPGHHHFHLDAQATQLAKAMLERLVSR